MNFHRSGRYTVYTGLLLAAITSWFEFGDWLYPVEALAVLAVMRMWLPKMKPASAKLARIRLVVAALFSALVWMLAIEKGLFSLATLGVISAGLGLVAFSDLRGESAQGN